MAEFRVREIERREGLGWPYFVHTFKCMTASEERAPQNERAVITQSVPIKGDTHTLITHSHSFRYRHCTVCPKAYCAVEALVWLEREQRGIPNRLIHEIRNLHKFLNHFQSIWWWINCQYASCGGHWMWIWTRSQRMRTQNDAWKCNEIECRHCHRRRGLW